MKNRKILFAVFIITMIAFSSVAYAEDSTNTTTAPVKDTATLRAENKAKVEALRAENKAKVEALKAEEKAKRDAAKTAKDTATLKAMQDNLTRAISAAQDGLTAANAKLIEAKAAVDAATDKPTLEKARKLFNDARQLIDKGMRPILKLDTTIRASIRAATTANTTTQ